MSADNQLATTQQEPLAIAEPSSILAIISRAASDPSIDVDKMERLLGMAERMQDRDAERQFNAAFVKLQSEIPTIVATSVIPNRGKYERFEDVMRQIQPALTANGFTVSFSQSFTDNRVIETCKLKHAAGHSEENSFGVRLGGKADSETQADCKASTTAKRNALLNALNIVVRQDVLQDEDDPHNDGGDFITQKEADELRDWIEATESDERAFLDHAGAKKYEEIRASRLDGLRSELRRKEERMRK